MTGLLKSVDFSGQLREGPLICHSEFSLWGIKNYKLHTKISFYFLFGKKKTIDIEVNFFLFSGCWHIRGPSAGRYAWKKIILLKISGYRPKLVQGSILKG